MQDLRDDQKTIEPVRERLGRRGKLFLALIFLISLGLAFSAGYSLARGVWIVPSSLRAPVPEAFMQWLPPSIQTPRTASSELKDYAFELIGADMRQGRAIVDVRLVDTRSGKLVSDAVVFARRLDMAPEGMAAMTSSLEPQPSPQAGVYRFQTELTMEGRWRLSLAAKVQGEIGTVQGKLVLTAVP